MKGDHLIVELSINICNCQKNNEVKGQAQNNNESFMKDSKSTQWDFDC